MEVEKQEAFAELMANTFDETSFDFQIKSGTEGEESKEHFHTNVIIASATYKDDQENAGMAVPLNCTWYNIRSENNDLV